VDKVKRRRDLIESFRKENLEVMQKQKQLKEIHNAFKVILSMLKLETRNKSGCTATS
jgi:hypothetical protein